MEQYSYLKKRQQKFEAAGLCKECGKCPPKTGLKKCASCAEKCCKAMKKWKDKKTQEWRAAGKCTKCGATPKPGYAQCNKCVRKANEAQKRRKAKGKCGSCQSSAIKGESLCFECKKARQAKRQALKEEVFAAYGGYQCACCGTQIRQFLTIDHVNNDGGKHRREIGSKTIHRWLRKHNFPAGFQVLCFNCNHGRHLNGGVCPHKTNIN